MGWQQDTGLLDLMGVGQPRPSGISAGGISINDGTLQRQPDMPTSPANESATNEPIISVAPQAPPPLYPSSPAAPRLDMSNYGGGGGPLGILGGVAPAAMGQAPGATRAAMPAGSQILSPQASSANTGPYGPESAVPYAGGPNQQGGMVRALMDAGGGRSAYGDVMLPADQVGARRGMSWAELTANNPTLGTQELVALRQRMIGANQGIELQNMQLANETNNRLRGVMDNPTAIALGRNQIEGERVANEQWGRTPAGRQAAAEASALQAFVNQPAGPNRAPIGDYVRMLQQAQQGGLFGSGAPSASIHPPGQQPIVQPTSIDEMRPPQMGVSSAVQQASSYQPGMQPSAYGPHEDLLNTLRTRAVASGETGVGGFLSQLDRNQPGFVGRNFPAVEAYLRDRYGNGAFEDASSGTYASPLGGFVTPMNTNAGFLANAGRGLMQAVSPLNPFARSMSEEQAGRAMLANLLRSRPR